MDSSYKVYMKLRIRNVTKEDFMQYKCVAKNSLGGSDGTITLYGAYFYTFYVSQLKSYIIKWFFIDANEKRSCL